MESSILELFNQKGRLRGDLIFNTDLQMHKGLIQRQETTFFPLYLL